MGLRSREEDRSRGRTERWTALIVGGIYTWGGILLTVLVVSTALEEAIGARTLAVVGVWQLWVMLALGVGMIVLGWTAYSWGWGGEARALPSLASKAVWAGVPAVAVGLVVGLFRTDNGSALLGLVFFAPEIAWFVFLYVDERHEEELGEPTEESRDGMFDRTPVDMASDAHDCGKEAR